MINMIDREMLIKELEEIRDIKCRTDADECDIEFVLDKIIEDIKKGKYDTKEYHKVDEYYRDNEAVWCK